VVLASSENDIAKAFASLSEQHLAAVSIGADPFFLGRCDQLVAVAARYALPAMHLGGALVDRQSSIARLYAEVDGW
jgi:putative ABC transport system substrate-binding protein